MMIKPSRRLRHCRRSRRHITRGGRCCVTTTAITALITITTLLFPSKTTRLPLVVHAYDQNDELSYLTNFDTLTSNSHSELSSISIEDKSWLTANCMNQGKLGSSSSTTAALSEVIVASPLSLPTITSSEVQLQCDPSAHCIIPQSLTLIMNSNLNVGGLTLDGGQLSWTDETTTTDGDGHNKYALCAGFVIVQHSSSLFHMKLSHPSSWGIIYIKNNGASPQSSGGMSNNMMGTRVFGTDKGGNMNIEGTMGMKRTWTLLRDSFGVGESMISVLHNVASMGWKVRNVFFVFRPVYVSLLVYNVLSRRIFRSLTRLGIELASHLQDMPLMVLAKHLPSLPLLEITPFNYHIPINSIRSTRLHSSTVVEQAATMMAPLRF